MNDFLMAAASATAGAPDTGTLEVLAEAGLDVADELDVVEVTGEADVAAATHNEEHSE